MQKSFLIPTTSLLVCVTTILSSFSPSFAQNPSQGTQGQRRPEVTSFECRGFSPTIFKITLNKNKTYTIQSRAVGKKPTNISKNLVGGKYVSFRKGFRFKTGELKNQSILRQDNNIYLVRTKDEARAAEVAAADGAAFCQQL
ncbi:hypothetical protein NIES4071_29680 [Calothrix sp. NIES-4071]|nr:hypothetical protein NIES4071_29680 [Calothrix sp. NIES-4071]BAZ57288.1 hypothetical protein NIES4105_29620 [Calothrix sp. NIES-4105]